MVARRIFEWQPNRHANFGSRIDGFVVQLAAFRPIDVFDIRPLCGNASKIVFRQLDLMERVDGSLIGWLSEDHVRVGSTDIEVFTRFADQGQLFEGVSLDSAAACRNYDCPYGLGDSQAKKIACES
jgi:hypothetical protein